MHGATFKELPRRNPLIVVPCKNALVLAQEIRANLAQNGLAGAVSKPP